jgi:hypothetical protein
MNTRAISFIIAGAFASISAFAATAAAPAGAPAGSTGLCKDGSYATAAVKKGACKGHKGVKDWYAADAGAATAAAPATAATPTPAAAPASDATSNSMKMKKMSTPAAAAAPGGGPGLVWANDTSKVYHCSTDKWYGKTKHGEYLSESDAKAKGFKPEHGKTCS